MLILRTSGGNRDHLTMVDRGFLRSYVERPGFVVTGAQNTPHNSVVLRS